MNSVKKAIFCCILLAATAPWAAHMAAPAPLSAGLVPIVDQVVEAVTLEHFHPKDPARSADRLARGKAVVHFKSITDFTNYLDALSPAPGQKFMPRPESPFRDGNKTYRILFDEQIEATKQEVAEFLRCSQQLRRPITFNRKRIEPIVRGVLTPFFHDIDGDVVERDKAQQLSAAHRTMINDAVEKIVTQYFHPTNAAAAEARRTLGKRTIKFKSLKHFIRYLDALRPAAGQDFAPPAHSPFHDGNKTYSILFNEGLEAVKAKVLRFSRYFQTLEYREVKMIACGTLMPLLGDIDKYIK